MTIWKIIDYLFSIVLLVSIKVGCKIRNLRHLKFRKKRRPCGCHLGKFIKISCKNKFLWKQSSVLLGKRRRWGIRNMLYLSWTDQLKRVCCFNVLDAVFQKDTFQFINFYLQTYFNFYVDLWIHVFSLFYFVIFVSIKYVRVLVGSRFCKLTWNHHYVNKYLRWRPHFMQFK